MNDGSNIQIQNAIEIIEAHSRKYLEWVKNSFQPGPFKGTRVKKPDFPILSPANKYYFEYSHFVECIEWFIRDELANGIIYDLLNLYGYELSVPDTKQIPVKFNNEHIEQVRPFEFIISREGKSIAYRYASIDTNKRYIKRLLRQYKVDQIVIIDWENDTPRYQKHFNSDITSDLSGIVYHIHIRDFLLQYFPAEVYDEYIKLTCAAVQKSHDEISIQVSPTLSLQYLAEFKANKKDWLASNKCRELRYTSAELSELPQLPKTDYDAIDASYFGDKLYRALVGKERFAESFITSEYMYSVFENGGRFDYTSIVCGYIKSIEQLLGRLADITISYHAIDSLWMKCNHYVPPAIVQSNAKYMTGIVCAKEPKRRKTVHVKASEENKSEFDTTFTPLTWFVYDNYKGWNISAEGVDRINDYLLEYAKEDRNEHFHKDNISEIEDVKRIRNNTILLLYLLLGGYRLTGNPNMDCTELGMLDDGYDRLYNRLIVIPKSTKNFIISFSGGDEIKAERLLNQESPAYDFYGSITSSVKFALTESRYSTDYETFLQSLTEDNTLVLSRTNIPENVWFVKPDGERVIVEW